MQEELTLEQDSGIFCLYFRVNQPINQSTNQPINQSTNMINMKSAKYFFLFLVLLLSLPACSKQHIDIDEAREMGGVELSGKEIRTLVAGKTLRVISWDKADKADVILHTSGKLSAENFVGEKTSGKWKVSKENRLCMKYDRWAGGFLNCYSVVKMDDGFKMFRTDSGLQSTFTILGGGQADYSTQGIGTGQTMPGSRRSPRAEKASSVAGREEGSWWNPLKWFGDEEEERRANADFAQPAFPGRQVDDDSDFVAPLAPRTVEMRHLIEDKECVQCDLSKSNLRYAKLKNADAEKINLSGADLQGAVLSGANLRGANLEGAIFSGADLSGADLSGANLKGANLEEANLEDAILQDANLSGARMVEAVLEDADVHNADLEKANLHWANLREANLNGANLKQAYLVKTDFSEADLTGADLTDAVIQRTNFQAVKGYSAPDEAGVQQEEKKSIFKIF
ncbi:MAG: pentapeptide repeat-containing protein [Desulfobulbaceae bacterium]|nr:pentapeptide repeat-containing protein [Desulfobulbaceae bacterium]